MKISIIIPVFNEEISLPKLIDYLLEIQNPELANEIIVVDGQSTDNTKAVVNTFKDVVYLKYKKGRAIQMNAGASTATGSVLYFLHCDSYPPLYFDKQICTAVKNHVEAGCFRLKFNSTSLILQLSQWFTRFNFKICRGGDQSLFISKKLFAVLGGFDQQYLIYEDNEFIARIYAVTKFKVLPDTITTSVRRYQKNGFLRLQYHFTVIHFMNQIGVPPAQLLTYYKRNVQ